MIFNSYKKNSEGTASSPSILLAVLAALFVAACDWTPEQSLGSQEQLFELCVQCHGQRGEGNIKFNAPAIAGLPQWYVEAQLQKFRSGVRGTHFDDLQGMQMRPMAISLHNDGEVKSIAAYVSSLPAQESPPRLEGGDASRGQSLFATCAACHGPAAAGNEQLKAPPLHGSSDWYLLTQLKKFKGGVRGGDPRDLEGAQMTPQMQTLADEQAMKDVIAHIMTLK